MNDHCGDFEELRDLLGGLGHWRPQICGNRRFRLRYTHPPPLAPPFPAESLGPMRPGGAANWADAGRIFLEEQNVNIHSRRVEIYRRHLLEGTGATRHFPVESPGTS